MKCLWFVGLFLLLLPFSSYGQSDAELLNRYIVQPDVWRPAQNANTNVSARGDLGLSIPVMTIPGRNGFDFTVRLSYQSGIKVRQESSWVGLGWPFDPGSITRQVYGGIYIGGTFYGVDFANNEAHLSDVYYVTLPKTSFSFARYSDTALDGVIPPRGDLQHFYALSWRPWTIEAEMQDPFTVGTGSNAMTAGYVYPNVVDREEIAAFVLTDEYGVRYVFGHPTMSSYRVQYPLDSESSLAYFVNTWRLLAILGTNYKDLGPTVDETDLPDKSSEGSWIRFWYSTPKIFFKEPAATLPDFALQTSYLTKIETPTHTAIFSTSEKQPVDSDAWDSGNTGEPFRKLNSIVLHQNYGLDDGPVVDSVFLDLTAFVPSLHDNKRYQLNEVRLFAEDGTTRRPGYSFTYYSQSLGVPNPDDVSKNTDHFGYFTTGDGDSDFEINQDTLDAKAWSLKSIKYPTGAKDVFIYENDVLDDQCVNYKCIGGDCYAVEQPPYCPSEQGNYQGGTRLQQVDHYADDNDASPESVTNYKYGDGALSGIPFWYLRIINPTDFSFKFSGRDRSAVYYDWVKQVNADGSTVKTFYTTSLSSGSASVQPRKTILYSDDNTFQVVADNRDLNWGIPHGVIRSHEEGSQSRTFTEVLDLTLTMHGFADLYDNADLVWRSESMLQRVEKNEGDDANSLTSWTEYEYDKAGSDATHLLVEKREGGDSIPTVVTEYTRTFEKYDGTGELEEQNILAPVIREDKAEDKGELEYLSSRVTTWKKFDGASLPIECTNAYPVWHPYRTYQWKDSTSSINLPAFSSSSWDNVTPPGDEWQLQNSNDFYCAGRLVKQTDANGAEITFKYNGFQNAYLTDLTVEGLTWEMDYYTNRGQLKSITDPNGTEIRDFAYDAWGRLLQVRNSANSILTDHSYYWARNSSNNWQYDKETDAPNSVMTTSYTGEPSGPQIMTEYYDGRARQIQRHQRDGSYDIINAIEYDEMGRPWRIWKPYRWYVNHAYDPNFASHDISYYGTTGPDANERPFTEQLYEFDPLGRVEETVAPGLSQGSGMMTDYGLQTVGGQVMSFTKTTDEEGDVSFEYADARGNRILNRRQHTSGNIDTHFEYDALDRLRKVIQPEGQEITYTYNTLSQLTEKSSPDADAIEYKYDAAGNLRFSQDANQADDGEVSYTVYDLLGRPIIRGEDVQSFSSLQGEQTYAWEQAASNWRQLWEYNAAPSINDYPWNHLSTIPVLSNTEGRLAATAYSAGTWRYVFYSYDDEGRVEEKHVYTEDDAGAIVFNTQIHYQYDRQGNLTYRKVTSRGESFYQWYQYNERGLLNAVYASLNDQQPGTAEVSYTYTATGAIRTADYRSISPITYRYYARDWIAEIDDVAGPSSGFAAKYTYFDDGNVSFAEFNQPDANTTTVKRYRYAFQYDALGRLDVADYSKYSGGSYSAAEEYDVEGLLYDANGNLKSVQRWDENATRFDNLTYTYTSGTNRLASITDGDGTLYDWDAGSGSFGYDLNGNLTAAPAPYDITSALYDVRNLPVQITSGGATINYRYSAGGQRFYKQNGGGTPEYYILDGSTVLGVVKGSSIQYWNIVLPAGDILGRIQLP